MGDRVPAEPTAEPLMQRMLETELSAKRYAESTSLIKEPHEVCPANRVTAMQRSVALREALRSEGSLRDATARNLSYYGPSGFGQTPYTADTIPPQPVWQPSSGSAKEALVSAYHTYPYYHRFWNDDDLLPRVHAPTLWEQQVHGRAAQNPLQGRSEPSAAQSSAVPAEAAAAAAAHNEEVAQYAHMAARREAELGSWERSYTELDPRSQLCAEQRLHAAECYAGRPPYDMHNPYLHPSIARSYYGLTQEGEQVTKEDMKE